MSYWEFEEGERVLDETHNERTIIAKVHRVTDGRDYYLIEDYRTRGYGDSGALEPKKQVERKYESSRSDKDGSTGDAYF